MVWDWSNKWWSSWMSQWEILPYQEPSDVTVHLYSVHEPFCQLNFSCSLVNDSNPSIPIALWRHCTIVQCAWPLSPVQFFIFSGEWRKVGNPPIPRAACRYCTLVHEPFCLFNLSSILWEIVPYQEPSVVTGPFHIENFIFENYMKTFLFENFPIWKLFYFENFPIWKQESFEKC